MKIRFLFSFYVYILDHFSGNWNCLVGGGGVGLFVLGGGLRQLYDLYQK